MNGRKCESKDCFRLKLGYCPFDYACMDSAYERFRKGFLKFNEQRANYVKSFSSDCVVDTREVKRS